MARIDNLDHFLTDVASSIKTKKEMEAGATITPANFDTLIESIDTLKGETKTITPTTSQQVITPSTGKNAITEVTVEAVTSAIDANIVQGNIKAGVTILGVTGNVEPDKPDQTKSCTPTTSQQVIEPDTGYELASVTVAGVTSAIDANITAGNIKSGTTILGVTGNYSGIDTSDANATASDILTGKSGYVNGVKINGDVTDLKGSSHSIPFKTIDGSSGTISYNSSTHSFNMAPGNTLSGNAMVNGNTNFIINVAETPVATAIGLTASEVAQGQTVLGVVGTYDGGVAAALAASY